MTNPEEQPKQGQQQSGDLGTELRELGQQIEQAIRTAITSDKAKQLQTDIASGMKEIGAQVQQAVRAIQDNPQMQNLADRGQQAVEKARESKAAQDLQEALARGIAQLNEQLDGFVTRLRAEDSSASASGAPGAPGASTSTDTSTTSPTTGETTRLKIDEE